MQSTLPDTDTISSIALAHGICDKSVRRWAKMAGFDLPRGNNRQRRFTSKEVKLILSQRDETWFQLRGKTL